MGSGVAGLGLGAGSNHEHEHEHEHENIMNTNTKTKRKNKRLTRAQITLQDPVIQRILAQNKELAKADDTAALVGLFKRMMGRVMPVLRHPMARRFNVRRAPRDVAFRYLRRVRGGEWYRGGDHVARLNFGPGVAFAGWVNDRAVTVIPELINVTLALPAAR